MKYFKDLIDSSKGGVYVIAEGCDNHMGSLDIAKGMIDSAKDSGADAIKFQHHLAEEEMLRNSPMSNNFDEPLFDFLERNALTLDQHHILKQYCDNAGIEYLCTPFSYKAAVEIKELVPFFKIGSGEFLDHWFIDQLIKLNKPILLSSGMCSWQELKENLDYLSSKKCEFAIMNCLSEYPPDYADMNLGVICKIKKTFPDLIVGHSDHSNELFSCISAVSLGAEIIEKHLSLSEFIPGPDQSVSITPSQFKALVNSTKKIKMMLKDEKVVQKRELEIREWAYRSIISKNDLKTGDVISFEDICTKRPGIGIPSKEYRNLIGKTVKRDIPRNSIISYSDIDE